MRWRSVTGLGNGCWTTMVETLWRVHFADGGDFCAVDSVEPQSSTDGGTQTRGIAAEMDRYDSQQAHLEALRETQNNRRDKIRNARRVTSVLPTDSDVHCMGDTLETRTCRFRNLCLNTQTERFFILKGEHSVLQNPPLQSDSMLELTTLRGHNVFFWRYEETTADYFLRKADMLNVQTLEHNAQGHIERRIVAKGRGRTNLTIVRGRTFLTKRFYPVNIMHVFHDDWLGLYSLRDVWPSLLDPLDEYYDPPSNITSHAVTVFEHHDRQSYDAAYEWLGRFQRIEDHLGWATWPKPPSKAYVCYQDAVVGNSKQLAWYQYGYGKPQGPLTNHTATGYKLREAALFALRRMGLPAWNRTTQIETLQALVGKQKPPVNDACIAIFSRLSTRLILNERLLATELTAAFNLPVCWIRLEELTMSQIIAKLRTAVMAFGMHGSLLILCMFLPPGAVLIEGYPYGVPAENYTPYRTMSHLSGVELTYRAWVASDPKASIGHPERGPRQGGLKHLNATYRDFILNSTTIPEHFCCDNPHWLYRIFQDTTVDPQQVTSLFWDGLKESLTMLKDK